MLRCVCFFLIVENRGEKSIIFQSLWGDGQCVSLSNKNRNQIEKTLGELQNVICMCLCVCVSAEIFFV